MERDRIRRFENPLPTGQPVRGMTVAGDLGFPSAAAAAAAEFGRATAAAKLAFTSLRSGFTSGGPNASCFFFRFYSAA